MFFFCGLQLQKVFITFLFSTKHSLLVAQEITPNLKISICTFVQDLVDSLCMLDKFLCV